MIMTLEVYICAVGGREGAKLEGQVLITEDGFENGTSYSFYKRLLG
jgi:Xaa-Pro dipeptidase